MRGVRNVLLVSPTNKPSFDPNLHGRVQVWTAHLDQIVAPELAVLRACLDPEEVARAQRFHFERDRRHFVAARGWLRHLLARYLELPPSEVRFSYGSRGKPFVMGGESTLRFNLSHSHGRAIFVVASGREVGIDLEAGARLGDNWKDLVRRVFSVREQAELASLPADVQRTGFLNGWTRKEAYLKATGLGIVDGLQSIEVTLDPQREARLLKGPVGLDWTLHDLRTDEHFSVALVTERVEPVKIERFDCTADF